MSGSLKSTCTTRPSRNIQDLTQSPSMELLLLRDEEHRAAMALSRKNRKSKLPPGMAKDVQLDKIRSHLGRMRDAQPESLKAVKVAEEESRLKESGPIGDYKKKPADITKRSLADMKYERLSQIDSEVIELRSKFNQVKSMIHMVYAGGMFFVAGYIAFEVYNCLYEYPVAPTPVQEEYRGIWNLWGIFS